jgi:hypothetical protein
LSRTPLATTLDPPRYVITCWGSGLFGGLFGYYSPPVDGRAGRFWDDSYLYDKGALTYATTAEFDAIVARALATSESPDAAPSAATDAAVTHHRGGTAVLLAAIFGTALVAVLGGLKVAVARVDRSVRS